MFNPFQTFIEPLFKLCLFSVFFWISKESHHYIIFALKEPTTFLNYKVAAGGIPSYVC